jgi:pimeloyl-ACP methyl ester carboxylesterase
VLLLHGFRTSLHMFRNLLPALADRYHLVAPDYLGFGQSSAMEACLGQLGVDRYTIYIQD